MEMGTLLFSPPSSVKSGISFLPLFLHLILTYCQPRLSTGHYHSQRSMVDGREGKIGRNESASFTRKGLSLVTRVNKRERWTACETGRDRGGRRTFRMVIKCKSKEIWTNATGRGTKRERKGMEVRVNQFTGATRNRITSHEEEHSFTILKSDEKRKRCWKKIPDIRGKDMINRRHGKSDTHSPTCAEHWKLDGLIGKTFETLSSNRKRYKSNEVEWCFWTQPRDEVLGVNGTVHRSPLGMIARILNAAFLLQIDPTLTITWPWGEHFGIEKRAMIVWNEGMQARQAGK